jgi:hypothetical protein
VCNNDAVWFCQTAALDPKHAWSFNFTTVHDHFDKLKGVMEEHGIPWENIYNMDEKGCQLGGGQKGHCHKYLFGHNSRDQYHIRNANLELVTVVECVSADGHVMKPYIIFKGKQLCHAWFEASGAERAAGYK